MNWILFLSIIGACAWIPAFIIPCYKNSRKIKCCLLDYRILTDATNTTYFSNTAYKGTVLLLCVNLYNPGYDFFSTKTKIKVFTVNNKFNTLSLEYQKTFCNIGNNKYYYDINEGQDFSKDMIIKAHQTNIKYIAVFVPELNIKSDKLIERIDIYFRESWLRKRHVKILKKDFPELASVGMIDKTKKLVEENQTEK